MKAAVAAAAAVAALNAASALAACMTYEQCPELLDLDTSECQDYHIFVSRGSDSPIPGHQSDLVKLVCEELGDCGFENIDYPAKSSYAGVNAWCESAHIGATAGRAQMIEYNKRCPKSNLIIFGFSQGGSVALDYVGGGGGGPVFKCIQDSNPSLDRTKAPGSQIAAIAIFGAVVRTGGMPYSVKNGKDFNGTSPRSQKNLAGLAPYSNILRDWCNHGDPICAKGSEPVNVDHHLNYFDLYNSEAAKWVIRTVRNQTSPGDIEQDSDILSATKSTSFARPTESSATAKTSKDDRAPTSSSSAVAAEETGTIISLPAEGSASTHWLGNSVVATIGTTFIATLYLL